MTILQLLQTFTIETLKGLFSEEFTEKDFQVSETKPEFEGDYTIVLFSLVKRLKKSPEEIGNSIGKDLVEKNHEIFKTFNLIKGFCNLTFNDNFLNTFLQHNYNNPRFGHKKNNGETVMVEYSSPNTNKPLHLGHLRNNFIGWSVAEILKANGFKVVKSAIVNDRGIHICKSMIAWKLFANGETPQSTNKKGDHFVGDYYVKFNDVYKEQVAELVSKGIDKAAAEKEAPIMKLTQQMLLDWENGEPEVMELWNKMNGWVYQGFDETYKRIGSDFDKTYYESQTYLTGKEFVQEGIEKGILFKKPDNSIWIDLTDSGLDEKLLLRGDGTSVYITQDIGLADKKYKEFHPSKSIYVIGDEQNYHVKVLQEICKKLKLPFAESIYHLSYGMVELPSGKMKSREGTVVDADDLVDEMIKTAQEHTEEAGKTNDFTGEELKSLFEVLAFGAMKFYLLRVDPKKKMIFNPQESIDFHGFTGPFIQYTYARIQSILRKVGAKIATSDLSHQVTIELSSHERSLALKIEQYQTVLEQAAEELNPAVVANYIFQLAKLFNAFYVDHSIANETDEDRKKLRLTIAIMTAGVLKDGMALLGIKVPERM
ncbi:MAG: arginine--tRNA ligase [Ginsengibacter sp.]